MRYEVIFLEASGPERRQATVRRTCYRVFVDTGSRREKTRNEVNARVSGSAGYDDSANRPCAICNNAALALSMSKRQN
ncbi:MAG TPA: hypothetical protein VF719_07835 [Abditibacteriaceae bacterium]|jgi:hypothetical protein